MYFNQMDFGIVEPEQNLPKARTAVGKSMEAQRLLGLTMAYFTLGRKDESDAVLEELIHKYRRLISSEIAYALAYRGELDRAFELLAQTNKWTVSASVMAAHQVLEPLHSDPRWLPFLKRVEQSPEQLAAIKFDVKVPQ